MVSRSLTNSAHVYRRILIFLLCLPLVFSATSCAKRSREITNAPPTSPANYTLASPTTQRLNLNAASAKELEVLPGIGKGLAERIVEHREKYGPFRRAEHLMMVRGISETRFRAVRTLVTVE